MQICLSELFNHIDEPKTFEIPVEFDTVKMLKETYPVVEKQPVHLVLNHLGKKKIQMNAEIQMTLEIPCARCLEPVSVPFVISVDTQLELPETPEEVKEESEEPYIDGYQLDVDALVRNELFVHMPLRVLCKEDCKGICKRCGTNLNLGTCDCDATELDPRMAAILDIFNGSDKS